MALATTLIPSLFLQSKDAIDNQVAILARYGRTVISYFSDILQQIIRIDFSCIVFMGNSPVLGIARESHLKVEELTDRTVLGKIDSFLGFQHGPKAIINNDT